MLPPVVVTASPLEQTVDQLATPALTLSDDELARRRESTLGGTLASEPGVSFDNFGGGASRPVIRGQTAPRIKVMSDGSDIHDASAISPDHAIATETMLLRGIEVLRGPAALLYGGGAIGGAINLLDSKIPTVVPPNGISGEAEARLGTADRERALAGGLTLGFGNFAIRAEGAGRDTGNYRVPGGFATRRVDGSYNDTWTASIGGAWIGENGYLGAAYTIQRNKYGLPGHNHDYEDCHPHGSSLHCEGHGHDDHDHDDDHDDHDDDHDHAAGDHGVPFVKLRSKRLDVRGEYRDPLPGLDRVRLRMSYTNYAHDEIEDDTIATTFKNKAYDVRTEFRHKPVGGLTGAFGVQYSRSKFSALGEEAFLPKSRTTNVALFGMETLQLGPVRFEVAARHEWQKVNANGAGKVKHMPFSISGAAIWEIDPDYSLALTLARMQRAPNVQELHADGVHLATNTYELGDASLKKETSKSVELAFRKRTGDVTFSLGVYHQRFSNYIFAATLDRFEDFRLIRYTSADATFTGIDGQLRYRFAPNLGITVFGDYVRARLRNGKGNLPRIPAGRLGARLDGQWGPVSAEFEYYRVFDQSKTADFEASTSGYNMLNATLAYTLPIAEARTELFVRGTNLTNDLAYNHASFIRNASPLRGRNVVVGLRAAF